MIMVRISPCGLDLLNLFLPELKKHNFFKKLCQTVEEPVLHQAKIGFFFVFMKVTI